jgi:hypothetical protein
MTDDQKGCLGMILLLQAELDGELRLVSDETVAHRRVCAECRGAIDVLHISRAIRGRLTRHALPLDARRRLLHRLSGRTNKPGAIVSMRERGTVSRE